MTRVILDTSAYSAFMRGDPEVKGALQEAEEIYLNAVILGELLAGFAKGKRQAANRMELRTFLASPRVDVLDVGENTAETYAVILHYLQIQGTPIPTNDIWIAATAMEYGLCVLTSDSHYLRVPQVVVKHFE
jgi:tRNA(fMet)-specific endonuclease VapC